MCVCVGGGHGFWNGGGAARTLAPQLRDQPVRERRRVDEGAILSLHRFLHPPKSPAIPPSIWRVIVSANSHPALESPPSRQAAPTQSAMGTPPRVDSVPDLQGTAGARRDHCRLVQLRFVTLFHHRPAARSILSPTRKLAETSKQGIQNQEIKRRKNQRLW